MLHNLSEFNETCQICRLRLNGINFLDYERFGGIRSSFFYLHFLFVSHKHEMEFTKRANLAKLPHFCVVILLVDYFFDQISCKNSDTSLDFAFDRIFHQPLIY